MTRAETKRKKRFSQQNGPISRADRVLLGSGGDLPRWFFCDVPLPPPPCLLFKSLFGVTFFLDARKNMDQERFQCMKAAIKKRGGHVVELECAVPPKGPAFRIICGSFDLGPRTERSSRFRKHLSEKGLTDVLVLADRQLTKALARLPISPKRDVEIKMKIAPFASNRSDGSSDVDKGDRGEPKSVYETRRSFGEWFTARQQAHAAAQAATEKRWEERAIACADRAVAEPPSSSEMVYDEEEYIMNQGI